MSHVVCPRPLILSRVVAGRSWRRTLANTCVPAHVPFVRLVFGLFGAPSSLSTKSPSPFAANSIGQLSNPAFSPLACLILCIAKLHDGVPSSYPITFLHLNRVSLTPYCLSSPLQRFHPVPVPTPSPRPLASVLKVSRFSVVASSLLRLPALRQSTKNTNINHISLPAYYTFRPLQPCRPVPVSTPSPRPLASIPRVQDSLSSRLSFFDFWPCSNPPRTPTSTNGSHACQ